MCYVIFPVDYPGRTSMFTEFELKQITYLQRSECTIDFVLSSNLKNKQLFQKDKLKVPRDKGNKSSTTNNQNNLVFQIFNLNFFPFLTLSKAGMYSDGL